MSVRASEREGSSAIFLEFRSGLSIKHIVGLRRALFSLQNIFLDKVYQLI